MNRRLGTTALVLMASLLTSFSATAQENSPGNPKHTFAIGDEAFLLDGERIVLRARHLPPGERIPDPPAPLPVMAIPAFKLQQSARVFDNLAKRP